MKSKDYLKQIAESKGVCPLTNVVKDNALLFPIGFEYIFKDLDRLEVLEKENQELIKKADCCLWKECNKISQENTKLKKAIDFLKLNFDISLDSKLRINDGSECIQTFIINLPENTTIDEMFEILREVLCNE